MLVFRNKIDVTTSYPLSLISDPEKILFFDIETTGFSKTHCSIYLIGCMYQKDDTLMYTQWFAENKNDEANVLMAFYRFMKQFDTIIHFNGNRFDIPFIVERGKRYQLDFIFDHFQMVDLYKSVRGMKHILHIENQKQKSFEKLLGITRIDPFSGGELITLYLEFIRTKNEKLLLPLLLHNKEDVTHMASLLSLLSITDLFHGKFFVNHTETNTYTGIHNFEKQDFTMMLSLEQALPIRISYQQDGICFLAEEQSARLSIPVLCDTLKLFFDNYKEYDYLPMEDRAIHKSIATFVDSSCKKAATPSTCYDKVFGNFIPIYNNDVPYAPYFQHHRKEKPAYIRLNDLKEEYMNAYALHILSHFR